MEISQHSNYKAKIIKGLLEPEFLDTLFHSITSFDDENFIENYRKKIIEDRGSNNIIALVAAPKTGSTLLSNTLGYISGHDGYRLCYDYNNNEHDLYLPHLSAWNKHGVVSQLHMKGTKANVQLLNLFGIRPLIMIRNIFDIIASLFNQLNRGDAKASNNLQFSFLWQDQPINEFSDDRKLDFLIDMSVPWYINFYVSWYHYTKTGQCQAMWVDYDQLMGNWTVTLNEICQFLGLEHNHDDATLRILREEKYSTYHSGKSGTGGDLLSTAQKERILKMVSYYPEVDFMEYGFLNRSS